jgi:uncharacterized protein (DUF924 family)
MSSILNNLLAEEVLPEASRKLYEENKKFAENHSQVIRQFGRYPHRNQALGRESTEKEKEWLAWPDRPGWAQE